MQLRHVVTCFLRNPADDTVLLGRRSDRVSTYPGHWAAISGSVEDAGPMAQAYREVEEETGLGSSRVHLLAEGPAVRFPDWELGIVWVVHPYLFRCETPEAVRPDWEHVRFQWADPGRIRELLTVPKLAEAYEAARLAEGGPEGRRILQAVREDRKHGAEELGLGTLEGLKAFAQGAVGRLPAQVLARMRDACREALELRPSMAAVRSAALRVFGVCQECLAGEDPAAEHLVDCIAELIAARERDMLAPAAAAACFIPDGARIVTLSRSSTVLALLRDVADRVAAVSVAESRPGCEGRGTAWLAASFGIATELLTDAAAARAVQDADLVLFGADSILSDGSIVNKTGTFALCCAADRCGVEAACVTTESKVLPAGAEPEMEEMPPGELGEPIEGVRARNAYFEVTSADLVRRVVVGSGVLEAQRLQALSDELHQLQEALES